MIDTTLRFDPEKPLLCWGCRSVRGTEETFQYRAFPQKPGLMATGAYFCAPMCPEGSAAYRERERAVAGA